MQGKKISIGAGFLLIMSLLFFFDDSGMFAALILSALVHELGHLFGIALLKSKVTGVRLELTGAAISYDSRRVSYFGEAAIALSGPLFGLVFAVIAASMAKYHEDLLFISGVSFSLSLLNLLPARNLDGGRILLALLSRLKNEDFAERVVCLSSCLVSFAMLVLGWFILIYTRGNFSFLLVGIWLLFDIARMSLRG